VARKLDSIPRRLRHWRDIHAARELGLEGTLSLENLAEAVRPFIAGRPLARQTVSSYETTGANPKSDYLVALKRAFPQLSLEWLLLGQGPPTMDERQRRRSALELAAKMDAEIQAGEHWSQVFESLHWRTDKALGELGFFLAPDAAMLVTAIVVRLYDQHGPEAFLPPTPGAIGEAWPIPGAAKGPPPSDEVLRDWLERKLTKRGLRRNTVTRYPTYGEQTVADISAVLSLYLEEFGSRTEDWRHTMDAKAKGEKDA
jgi:hypothetical protein